MHYGYFLPLVLSILLTAAPSVAHGQSIDPSGLATSGGYGEARGGSLSWTVGQLASGTHVHRGGVLTEGVQQPFLQAILIREAPAPFSMSLYPNPARQNLLVTLRGVDDDITLILFDMIGKPVARHLMRHGDSMLRVPVTQLADGLYLLAAFSRSGERLAVYKIIKAE